MQGQSREMKRSGACEKSTSSCNLIESDFNLKKTVHSSGMIKINTHPSGKYDGVVQGGYTRILSWYGEFLKDYVGDCEER